jgi:hypothetical protein
VGLDKLGVNFFEPEEFAGAILFDSTFYFSIEFANGVLNFHRFLHWWFGLQIPVNMVPSLS